VEYELSALRTFIDQDPKPAVTFYGGEPLLELKFIREVMDRISAEYWVIQTNGLLVRQLDPEYWRRFDVVLLSIDGRPSVTDYYRGEGVYARVIEAARWLRSIGFEGDLIARMTVGEHSDIFKEVTHLIKLNLFDHVHWQLDVVWSDRWIDFRGWLARSYYPGLKRLMNYWLSAIERRELLGVAPFLGILRGIHRGKLPSPPCEAGERAFAILPNGLILACPIAFDAPWAYLGHIETHSPSELPGRVRIEDPCRECPEFALCGGRCLYAHKERLWGMEGFYQVCEATRFLLNLVRRAYPRIRDAVNQGLVGEEVFAYPEYNNSIEIIP